MRHSIRSRTAVAVLILMTTGTLAAQQLERSALTAGGGTASGGRFEAVTTIGQPAVARSAGDAFELQTGFLFPRPGAAGSLIFRDEFEALPGPTRDLIAASVAPASSEDDQDDR